MTCPEPTVPRPTSRAGSPADDTPSSSDERPRSGEHEEGEVSFLPPRKKSRTCGIAGHALTTQSELPSFN